ncbi:MFS transporter [Amycolatopsis alkalitolerans]|uniref:MFS transporter n=1 Tax=Amycolatopsis alkalitolerans TaxID=2547244 RepID=A0A5C4M519_9PSEU|nr:MFS transporter [Amycolatopsis alkalitolerans]TNC26505.1 MFS transporter [Amycolatopsis alkalitolerans]
MRPAPTYDQCLAETPLPRRVLGIAAIASTAVIFDGYDLQALSYALPKLIASWHFSPVQAGLLATYTFIGLFAGAVGLGALGDRWGRKRTIVVGVIVFALFMGTAGFARGYTEFAILRFCASVGMGGVLPGTIAMLSEYVPVRRRARMIAISAGCFTFGFMVAAIAAIVLVPRFGWRPLFHLSYLALIVAALIAWLVPETPQYLATRRMFDRALAAVRRLYPAIWPAARDADPETFFSGPKDGKIQFRTLWTRRYRRSTVALSLLYLFLQFVVYALDFWMVSLLVKHGLSLVSSYSYAIEQAAAATVGGFAIGWVLDRVNPYFALAVAFAAGGVCLTLFGFATSLVALYTLNALAGALIIGGQNVVHTLVMATYGPEARATGLGWALGIGRLGGLLGPLIGGFLLRLDLPFPVYFLVFAIPAVLCAITAIALRAVRPPLTANTELKYVI